jgi:hypothetical protein
LTTALLYFIIGGVVKAFIDKLSLLSVENISPL